MDTGHAGNAPLVLTVGHSTRTIEEFLSLLLDHGVSRVADVRTIPRSRRNPQFDREALPAFLEAAGIAYGHMPELGGLRKPRPDSPNGGLRNASFRGYADHMLTQAFAAGIERLLELARRERVTLMCAEAVPWRCHRSLLADSLAVRGVPVEHILGRGRRHPHALSPAARVEGGRLLYPPS